MSNSNDIKKNVRQMMSDYKAMDEGLSKRSIPVKQNNNTNKKEDCISSRGSWNNITNEERILILKKNYAKAKQQKQTMEPNSVLGFAALMSMALASKK